MSYSTRDSRPDSRRQAPNRRSRGGSHPQGRSSRSSSRSGRGSRPSSRSSRGNARSRTRNLTGPDTGYTLHSHRVNYSRRGGTTRDRLGFIDGRFILLVIIVIVVVVVLIAGISSCVSGSTQSQDQQTQQEEQTETQPRVASGISDELTQQFNAVLDRNDQMAQIAQTADQYDDDRLLTLALNEPEAISFVANYLTADKSASSYTDQVTQGQVPQLYDWDTRWGYVSYGDGCIGVTGSAPTTVAMAYMGLTGKSDQTPATIAQGVSSTTSSSSSSTATNTSSNSNSNSSSSSTTSSTGSDSAESVIRLFSQVGLEATQYDSSSDTLVNCLSSTSVAAVYIEDDALEDEREAHWALVVGMNSDGTLNVFDPTSSLVSTHTWDSSTIANASSTILYVTVSESAQDDSSDEDTASDYSSSSTGYYSTEDDESSDTSTGTSTTSGTSSYGSTSGSSSDGTTSSGTSSTSGSGSSSSSSTGSSSSSDYVGL